eukprot:CAMPEP_0182902092 /NCGR_PEP_ID=MMETSP0034_2-20130328/30198_1 /TAXON_ID=156128 /ORGANISM="Nephroselmis pyriformis, Strain CCMP717" /LENGTH=45 /DNA_ID= /DNA_START= /DNA_END= /DNA_ORIENTATION=
MIRNHLLARVLNTWREAADDLKAQRQIAMRAWNVMRSHLLAKVVA